MTYLSGKAEKKRRMIRYGIYVAGLFLMLYSWMSIKHMLYPVTEPLLIRYGATKESVGSFSTIFRTYITTRETLIKKDKDLMVDIERLENVIAEKDAQLRELHMILADTKNENITSTVVMYPLMQDMTKMYSTILLSKGFKDGVEVGAYVYVRGLQPVCIIKEVYTMTSLCQLLSASSVITEAVTDASSSISLTLSGRGGGTFLANVPRDTAIAIGDRVLLKGDQSMVIGSVVDVIHNNQDTSWHVFVRGMYNPLTSSVFYMYKK